MSDDEGQDERAGDGGGNAAETVPAIRAPGGRFGRYAVVRLLGSGGMGDVFEARHIDLDKRVALKVLNRKIASSKVYLERFLREGRIVAKLDHPHVVTVFDVGTEDGKPYLVMEFLTGRDLSVLLEERGRLPVEEAIDLVLPVLSALDVAHRTGLVHRDLKPANVFLARAGHGGVHPKLLDFGIAKPNQDEGAGLTGTGEVFGTPQYMAPEQVRRSRDATAQSDQYSMAVLLYRCLTGVEAFEFGDSSVYALFERVVSGSFSPPRSKRAELPEQLEAVILRAMSREPADRYPSVTELGAALLPFASATARHIWTGAFATPEAVAVTVPPPGEGAARTPGSDRAIAKATSAAEAEAPIGPGTLAAASRDMSGGKRAGGSPRGTSRRTLFLGLAGVAIGVAAAAVAAGSLARRPADGGAPTAHASAAPPAAPDATERSPGPELSVGGPAPAPVDTASATGSATEPAGSPSSSARPRTQPPGAARPGVPSPSAAPAASASSRPIAPSTASAVAVPPPPPPAPPASSYPID